MKCHEVMTENPLFCLPDDSVGQAARLLRREQVGSVPVVTDDRRRELIGILTDHDLAIKIVGESRDANRTKVYDVMTRAVIACRDDDDISSAVLAMQEYQIRRVPIVDYSGQLIGIISHGDVSHGMPPASLAHTLWRAA